MGSLRSDGTRISQSRQSVRALGPGITLSADRRESETIVSNSGLDSSTSSFIELSQLSVVDNGWTSKTTNSIGDDVARVTQGSGFVEDVPDNPDPFEHTSLSGPIVGDLIVASGTQILWAYERRPMVGGGTITLLNTSPRYQLITGTSARRVNLPATPTDSLLFDVKDLDGTAGTGPITIHGNGLLIDGAVSGIMNVGYESRTVLYNGVGWSFV